MNWHDHIRTVPDWPKPGILFRDITPLLADGPAFNQAVSDMVQAIAPWKPEVIVGAEARGFIFGAACSLRLGIGFVPIRKKGKLPAATIDEEYALEYGTDSIQIHADALQSDQRTVFVDDLLATGGTAAASARLIRKCGAHLTGIAFAIELAALHGRAALPADVPVEVLLSL